MNHETKFGVANYKLHKCLQKIQQKAAQNKAKIQTEY